jgi:hypothetical protein
LILIGPVFQRMFQPRITFNKRIEIAVSSVLLLLCATFAAGQSTSLEYPTPVTGSEISGVITARDVGDSRLTRHFYLLSGTTGDLTLTLQYSNLDGDVDLFTVGTMRPLAKIAMVAGDRPISAGRTVFLRLEEKLILRIEARTANDDPGQYRVNFSGTFLALAAQDAPPDDPQVTSKSSSTSRRRVTSSGQVIVEPDPPPVAKVIPPKPPPTVPTPKPKLTAKTGRGAATTPAKPPAGTGSTTGTANARGKRPVRKPPPAKTPPPAEGDTTAPTETAEAADPPSTPPPVTPKRGSTRRGSAPGAPAPEPAPDPMANARLVVETRDGMRREHFMRDVRRFTVERGLLLVLLKDGTSEREPMSNVQRVTIEP